MAKTKAGGEKISKVNDEKEMAKETLQNNHISESQTKH